MLGRSHAISGAAAYVALSPASGAELIGGIAVCAVAALGPDIDSNSSTLGRLTPLWRVLPHRRLTHYALTSALIALGLWVAWGWTWWTTALALGWFVHQVGDVITVAGIRWLWPAKVVVRGPIHAGGLIENAIIAPALLAYLAWHVAGPYLEVLL